MKDASWTADIPWNSVCDTVKKVVIGQGVTSIGKYAFRNCKNLSSVTIPSSVTRIGDDSFEYCSSLTSLTIPNNVTNIGHWAFNGCSGLSSLSLGSGVTAIGQYAFSYCTSLTTVTIPASVSNIGEGAFNGCSSLKAIQVASGNRNYVSDSAGVLFNKAKTELILCPQGFVGNYSIPATVKDIDNNAFYICTGLTGVTIPYGVTTIGNLAFARCSALTSISLPDSVTTIGDGTFENCSNLSSITFGSGLTRIGYDTIDNTAYYNNGANWTNGLLYLGAYLIDAKKDVTSAAIRSGTRVIADTAFANCRDLSSVTLPNGLITIGGNAFTHKSKLSSITIPSSVTTIGFSAFYGCSGLSSITIPNSVTDIGDYLFFGCSGLSSITMGSNVRHIGSSAFEGTAFYDNTSNWANGLLYLGSYLLKAEEDITSASIRSGTKVIADSAFTHCNLTKVSFPSSLITIGDWAFYDCSFLTSATIPNGVTTIGGWAFDECTSLASISIPDSVTYIGEYAFSWCLQLSKITLPESIDAIQAGTFFVCSALEELTVPEGVTTIGKYAFGVYDPGVGCNSLKNVTLPESLTSVEENAFSGCENLEDVYYVGSKTQWSNISIAVYNDPLLNASFHYNCLAAPAAPTLSSAIVTSTGKIRLSWNAVDNAVKYYIYRCTDGNNYKYYDSTKNTSYTNSSVTPGTTYYYKVVAVSGGGAKSAYSNRTYRTADCAKPSLSSSNVSTGGIKLSWKSVDGAVKYYIYRSTDGGKNYSFYDSTKNTTYTNKSVTPGNSYYYKIKAICANTNGNSAYSNVANRTADCVAPKISSSNVSTGGIKLTWSAVEGASKYYIYRSTDGGKTYTRYDTTTSTSYTNKSVTPGKSYYYKVVAVCAKSSYGNSAYSNVANRTADCAAPKLSIQLSSGKPQLKWSAVDGASKYYIYRSTDGKNFSFFDSTTKTSYTNTGAKSGTTYYYKLIAVCKLSSYGNSAYSNTVSIKSK